MNIDYLVITYKQPQRLARTVSSVEREAMIAPANCIIVDDCEREALLEFGVGANRSMAGCTLALRVIQPRDTLADKDNHRKSRMGWGLNRAVAEMSTADLFMMLCDDDLIVPGATRKIIRWFEEHPDEDWAYGASIPFDATITNRVEVLPGYLDHGQIVADYVPVQRTRATNVLDISQVVWRRAAHVKHNIQWADRGHPRHNPLDHMIYQHMDGRFEKECPFIGFPIQYKGIHTNQVSKGGAE